MNHDGNERRPNPEKLAALRALPAEILKTLTREEVQAVLFEEQWPSELREKLKDYLAE